MNSEPVEVKLESQRRGPRWPPADHKGRGFGPALFYWKMSVSAAGVWKLGWKRFWREENKGLKFLLSPVFIIGPYFRPFEMMILPRFPTPISLAFSVFVPAPATFYRRHLPPPATRAFMKKVSALPCLA